VYLAYYGRLGTGCGTGQLANIMIVQKDPVWRRTHAGIAQVQVGDATIPLVESRIESSYQRLLVWHWMRVAAGTSTLVRGQSLRGAGRSGGAGRDGFGIVVYAPYTDSPERTGERMQAFSQDMLPSINDAITID